MGYNTRRVSLSLPSLGIALPGSNSSSRAHHKSALSATASTPSAGVSKPSSDSPPTKRLKRSHTLTGLPGTAPRASLPSRPRKSSSVSARPLQSPTQQTQQQKQQQHQKPKEEQEQQQQQKRQKSPQFHRPSLLGTPPPSPRNDDYPRLDTQGIGDDIVVAVLEQLQSTGNRPHLIKELVAVLINTLSSVESSQNPVAIISSRLTNYLKRPWTALAPCPLTKEQVTVHPRRVYYYLTTIPRQEIPEYADHPITTRHIMSPSVSSGPEEEEEMEVCMEDRSPSPEVEFLSAEYLSLPNGFSDVPFSTEDFQDGTTEASQLLRNTRLGSPPLELDEREFTHAASVMQLRKASDEVMKTQRQLMHDQMEQTPEEATESRSGADNSMNNSFQEGFDNSQGATNVQNGSGEVNTLTSEDAALLWGQTHTQQSVDVSSPLMRPQLSSQGGLSLLTSPRKTSSVVDGIAFASVMHMDDNSISDAFGAWGELKSPENVELAELDDMFGGF